MVSKRGVSGIIAVVLILLITIAAFSIIASFIIPFVKNSLEEGGQCIDYNSYFNLDNSFGFNCYNLTSLEHKISVRAGAGSEEDEDKIIGIALIFAEEAQTKRIDVISGEAPSSELKMIDDAATIEIPRGGEVRTYVYKGTRVFESVEVHPLLKGGDICPKTDSVRLNSCR